VNVVIALLVLAGGILFARMRRRQRFPAKAVIVSPRKSTVIRRDGAVRSVQSAELLVSPADLERLWTPRNLENLARTYWSFLSRVTLGLVRVQYGENERRVVFLVRPLTLLRFETPDYVIETDHGKVSWRIRDGLLVTRAGRGSGFLALDVRRMGMSTDETDRRKLYIEVEVANFYPSIASSFSTPVYTATQSVVHVLVTHAFLRSLAALELEPSKVGLLTPDVVAGNGVPADSPPAPADSPRTPTPQP
jgi:hypothetical protein